MAAARRRLEAAIDEVAAVWNGLPAPAGDRPWLDSATEERLDNAITERFRARDLPGAMAAIENWRSAWLAILPAQPSDQRRDWLAVESDVLGGEVIVFVRDDQTPVPGPHAGAVRYTVAELEPLQGLDADALRAVHAAKKALGGVVGGQDKAMSGESDARRPLARELPGLNDGEILRRLNNPKTPVREWQRCAHAAAARGLVGHPAPDHAGGFRPQPFEFCSPEKPAPGHRRWRSFQGVVVCGSCHPPAAPELVAEWLDEPKGGGPQEH